ncbi:unnamed protein product [Caenorhabditis auriculariae]|uniref:Uncharacterized protein n=1 Tax=Caenorhabditis auriculariae TaxID=2777116 RepID=A0A8S1H7F1_9PELO|nr:unnamed protein product [Caenorhabditis auriculariae]
MASKDTAVVLITIFFNFILFSLVSAVFIFRAYRRTKKQRLSLKISNESTMSVEKIDKKAKSSESIIAT